MNPNDPTTIGIRVPNCSIARSILAQTGALATTSANLSGQPPFISLEAIAAAFPDILVLDTPETSANGLPSTVAKWTGARWEILRQGSIKEISDHG
jgi:L-threonylcarbamoyladenylate synthase